jgi:hypothetical protein
MEKTQKVSRTGKEIYPNKKEAAHAPNLEPVPLHGLSAHSAHAHKAMPIKIPGSLGFLGKHPALFLLPVPANDHRIPNALDHPALLPIVLFHTVKINSLALFIYHLHKDTS